MDNALPLLRTTPVVTLPWKPAAFMAEAGTPPKPLSGPRQQKAWPLSRTVLVAQSGGSRIVE